MDPEHNKGIQNRVCSKPQSGKTAQSGYTPRPTTKVGKGGDNEDVIKRGNYRSPPRESRLLLQPVFGPQKRRGYEASHQSEEPQHLYPSPPFQDGGPPHIEGSPEERRLDDQGRSEGCILHDPHPAAGQMFPAFLHGKPRLPVFVSAVRPVLCSLGLYQDPEASTNSAQRARSEASGIHRRHLSPCRDQEMAQSHTEALIYLLQNLGYIVHPEKTVKQPTQEIEFLGMVIDSRVMELRLSGQKIKKLRQEAAMIIKDYHQESITPPTIRRVSRLLGKFNSVSQAVPPGPVLQSNSEGPSKSSRTEQSMLRHIVPPLTRSPRGAGMVEQSLGSLEWEEPGPRQPPDLQIESDASLMGWGASCQGIQTGGPWSQQEKKLHINCLELLAATLAVKTFLKDQENKRVLLLLDNMTAVAYVNNLGGTVSAHATKFARELWMWCLQRDILLTAQHLPGKENVIADRESRVMKDRSDWMLNPVIFCRIQEHFSYLEVDLFATRLTHQLPRFYSWRPDPLAEATDAFLQDWSLVKGYANPPWNLIGRVLRKVESQEVELILIAPIWPSQPWYPRLLSLLVSNPLRIDPQQEVITEDRMDLTPPLAVWPISGNTMQIKNFHQRFQTSSYHHGDRRPHSPMTHSVRSGSAGALRGSVIQFQDL